MRTPNYTEEDHKHRTNQFWELVRKHRNLTLSLIEPHLNPYRDLSTDRLDQVEMGAKNALLDALPEGNIPVLIHADEKTRSSLSFEYAEKQKSRGDVVRLVARDRLWFEQNWDLFSNKQMESVGSGLWRHVFVFLKFEPEKLSGLVSPWWDPNVLTNPNSVITRSILKEVDSRIEPGTVAVSFILLRMRSFQLYFHSDDVDSISRCACGAAQKTEWGDIRL
jgi:hypothetical protein